MTTTTAQLAAVRPSYPLPWRFRLAILDGESGENGQVVGRLDVLDEDIDDSLGEAWRDGILRKGHPGVPFDDTPLFIAPIWAEGGGPRVSGFLLEVRCPDGTTTRLTFPIEAFSDVALRFAQVLIEEKKLNAGAVFFYEVQAHRGYGETSEAFESGRQSGDQALVDVASKKIASKSAPLVSARVPLPPLLAKARSGSGSDMPRAGEYPVLYAEAALARAEALARKGATATPPVETGGVLVGRFCTCPETGEFYVIVVEALEARDAVEDKFSLSYTGATWTILRNVLKVRQRSDPALRIVGQAHGHSFPPAGGAPPCEACATAKVCGRTNVFVSADDCLWSRAVFHRQPWQLCQIFGLNARGDGVSALFGLKENRLLERGFHVLRDADVPSGGATAFTSTVSREEVS